MPTREKPIDIVLILLKHLNQRNPDPTPQSNPDLLHNTLKKIKAVLEDIKDDSIPRFNHCNEALIEKLTQLESYIADEDKIKDNINWIEENLGEIQDLKTRIQRLELGKKPPQEDQSVDEAKKDSRDWLQLRVEENILNSLAMDHLQRSYDVLDIQLKLCLLCLAIFPQEKVKKKSLIYWWIGEGLISKSRVKSAVEVGEGVFLKLIEKGLIQPYSKNPKKPIVDGCTMHPWIRRMLIAAAKKAYFFDFDDAGKINVDNNNDLKSQRVCLVLGSDIVKEEELFTIFNVNVDYLSLKAKLFSKFRKLVVVQLGRWQNSTEHHIEVDGEEFLKELGAQKHLRYLSLHGISRITALPPSIVKCVNLEILDLRACHNLERLPSDIGALRKLTHLDVSQCYLLESMPKGIEKISSLQVLKGFVIGRSRKNPCKLGDLGQLKKLRKLSIHIGSNAVTEEGELNKLKEITSLRILTISWGQVGTKTAPNGQAPQLTETASFKMRSFSFPPKLVKLDLRCLPQEKAPEWLKPSNMEELKRLYIRGGALVRLDPEENKKWKVEILRLKYLKNLKLEGKILQKDFPDLVYFEKIKCRQIGPYLDDNTQYETNVEWNNAEGWEELRRKLESTSTIRRENQDNDERDETLPEINSQ
ncbi:unnamed protein product [Camellia sinensis]